MPEITPLAVYVVPASVCSVPPSRTTMARLAVMSAVLRSVPPSRVNVPAASPRLASVEMASVPAMICQGVTAVVEPVSVQVFGPSFWYPPKLRYCPAGPISAVSKLASVLPARPSVSLFVALPMTLPSMTDVGSRPSQLLSPVKRMASVRLSPSPDRPPRTVPPFTKEMPPVAVTPTPPVDVPTPPRPPSMMPSLMRVPGAVSSRPVPPAPAAPGVKALPPVPPWPPRMLPVLYTSTPSTVLVKPAPPLPPLPPLTKLGPPLPPAPPVMTPEWVPMPVATTPSEPAVPSPPFRKPGAPLAPGVPVVIPKVLCAQALVPARVASAIRQALARRVVRGMQASPAVADAVFRLPLATSETAWQAPVEGLNTRQ